ncbi:MAG: hypothetical protein J6Q51_02020 [Clostridia bacterium]|nr:hypothetical protein [Clostridia bacterium]
MKLIKTKYTNIKLCKGIYIDEVKQIIRKGETGISTAISGLKWYLLPKGRAIFKSFEGPVYKDIRLIRIANELLCQELAKQVEVDCAVYQPATHQGINGLLSFDVTGKNEELISGFKLHELAYGDDLEFAPNNELNSYIPALKELQKMGFKFNLKEVIFNLYKIAVFDSLTAQSDRHIENTFFIINLKAKTVKVAPLIDNELAFNAENETRLAKNFPIGKLEINKQVNNISKQLVITEPCTHLQKTYDKNLAHIVALANINPELKQILFDMIRNYNLDKAISEVERKGTILSPSYKKYLLTLNKVVLTKYKKELVTKKANPLEITGDYSNIINL